MSKINNLIEDAKAIQKGLFSIGRNRVAALPAHTTWELTDDLEKRIANIVKELETLKAKE